MPKKAHVHGRRRCELFVLLLFFLAFILTQDRNKDGGVGFTDIAEGVEKILGTINDTITSTGSACDADNDGDCDWQDLDRDNDTQIELTDFFDANRDGEVSSADVLQAFDSDNDGELSIADALHTMDAVLDWDAHSNTTTGVTNTHEEAPTNILSKILEKVHRYRIVSILLMFFGSGVLAERLIDRGKIEEYDETDVYVHVYDLEVADAKMSIKCVNACCRLFGSGIYHTEVELYGVRYGYGETEEEDDEAWDEISITDPPHRHDCQVYHADEENPFGYRGSVKLGQTAQTKNKVLEMMNGFKNSPEWLGTRYHLLAHNCTDASKAVVIALNKEDEAEDAANIQDKLIFPEFAGSLSKFLYVCERDLFEGFYINISFFWRWKAPKSLDDYAERLRKFGAFYAVILWVLVLSKERFMCLRNTAFLSVAFVKRKQQIPLFKKFGSIVPPVVFALPVVFVVAQSLLSLPTAYWQVYIVSVFLHSSITDPKRVEKTD